MPRKLHLQIEEALTLEQNTNNNRRNIQNIIKMHQSKQIPQKLTHIEKSSSSLIMSTKLPLPRNMFVEYSNYVPQHQYNSARNSIQIEDFEKAGRNGKNSQSIVYCTIKSKQKYQPKQQDKQIQQNPLDNKEVMNQQSHLPKLPSNFKNHMMTRYFSRFDIVKDRAQNKSMSGSLKPMKNYKNDNSNNRSSVKLSLYAEQIKHFGSGNGGSENQHRGDNNNKRKYLKFQMKRNDVVGDDSNNKNMFVQNNNSINFRQQPSTKLWRNPSTISLTRNHSANNLKNITLEAQKRQLQIIRKKNEYQMYKMKRKHDYQRMRSNFIIADALNELIGKRDKVLLDDKYEELDMGDMAGQLEQRV